MTTKVQKLAQKTPNHLWHFQPRQSCNTGKSSNDGKIDEKLKQKRRKYRFRCGDSGSVIEE